LLLTKALDQPFKAKADDLRERIGIVGYSINPLQNATSTFIDANTLRRELRQRKTTVVLYQRSNIVNNRLQRCVVHV